MGDRSIELWLNQYQLEALERILSERGTDTETVMQARLMEFYRQTVPEQERTEINNMIEAERLADERRTQEMRHFSVYHITENGSECHFESDYGMEFMQTAWQMRRYLRAEFEKQPESFAAIFDDAIPIDAQRFDERIGELLDNSKNTIVYEQDEELHRKMFEIFSTGTSTDKASSKLHSLLCCLPFVEAPNLSYDNLFRIIIMQFIDAFNFDVRAIKKSCVHIVNKDNKIIPFETMNLFYRDDKRAYLEKLKVQTT